MRTPQIGSSEEQLTKAGVRESATRIVPSGSVLVVVRSGILARYLPVGVTTRAVLTAVIQEAYVQGISTRSVDSLVQALGMEGISKSQVSRLCGEIDERVGAFLSRPIEGEWPYLWLDATYVKARRDHRIVSVAVIVAVAVNTDGRREVLGMTVGDSEAEPFWIEFLRSLRHRGLRGVKLVVSDAHDGLKAAITKVLNAAWQRCRVHFMRNAMAHAGKTQRRIVAAWIGTAFAEADFEAARRQWRQVADQARPRVPKLAALMDDAEADVLAYMGFPAAHRAQLCSTNPLERLNKEIKRRSVAFNQDVKALVPTDDVEPRYLAAFLRVSEQHVLRDGVKKGATVHSIKSGFLEALRIPLPPLPEQRRIADVIDAAIAKAEAAARAAEAQQADLDRLEFRVFESAFPAPPLALEDDDAPDGWTWHLLTDLARLESGHTPSRRHPEWWGGDTPWIALSDIRALDGKAAFATRETINQGGLANSSARLLPENTVCLCRDVSVGFVTVLGRPMATSQHFVNWICGPKLHHWFLMYALMASRSFLRNLSNGALLQTIYMPTLKALRVCAPSRKEQARVLAHTERCRAELAAGREAAAMQRTAIDVLPSKILAAAFQGQL